MEQLGLFDYAPVYVPSTCTANQHNCSLHVVFHGCRQTIPLIGDVFYRNVGYNEWAEANNFVILYPQATANSLNLLGCWDWWGYTGPYYATKAACQMATVKNMIDYLTR